jgi:hypothetical protein
MSHLPLSQRLFGVLIVTPFCGCVVCDMSEELGDAVLACATLEGQGNGIGDSRFPVEPNLNVCL